MRKQCLVVVADDNPDAADSLAILIESLGYSAMATYDGHEAVEACAACAPAVAILDVQMPRLHGCAAARMIRQSTRPPSLIASHTALAHDQEPLKSEGHVFDLHLSKPARMDEIRELIVRVLAASGGPETVRGPASH